MGYSGPQGSSPLFPVVIVTRDTILTYGQDAAFPLIGI